MKLLKFSCEHVFLSCQNVCWNNITLQYVHSMKFEMEKGEVTDEFVSERRTLNSEVSHMTQTSYSFTRVCHVYFLNKCAVQAVHCIYIDIIIYTNILQMSAKIHTVSHNSIPDAQCMVYLPT